MERAKHTRPLTDAERAGKDKAVPADGGGGSGGGDAVTGNTVGSAKRDGMARAERGCCDVLVGWLQESIDNNPLPRKQQNGPPPRCVGP